jgi:hypothetical protein
MRIVGDYVKPLRFGDGKKEREREIKMRRNLNWL